MLLHSHQPVGNFDHVIEEAYQRAYSPFLAVLSQHEGIHASLHYSGVLLEWIETRHLEFFRDLRRLVDRGQVELLGGGFYEPILVSIPDRDKTAQVRKLSAYLRNHFGVTPRGAWLAERVWEPALAYPLAEAGVEYVVLDDTHFLAAGLDPESLRGYYLTEEAGFPLRLVPSLKALRYTIPFREPAETLDILRGGREAPSETQPGGPAPLFAFGDDCEKFGVWPGTFEHCYEHFWLERFMQALGEAREWLETTTISSYLAANPPLGRAYLPAASYPEMMEWSLPVAASREFKWCLEECGRTPSNARFRRFLLGGLWRNFLSKYPESNQLHKLMLEVSRRWHEASRADKSGSASKMGRWLAEAHDHLLAGQCNDAYWHGVFGGLYAPHLRAGVERRLIKAEVLLDNIESAPGKPEVSFESRDFDADGQKEILIEHPAFGMIVRPADGGTVSSLRFKPADVELVNSLARRPEAYHEQVRLGAKPPEALAAGPSSIHDHVASKELNLASFLRYDRYLRHAFRTFIFPTGKTAEDYAALALDENPALAGGAWGLRTRQGLSDRAAWQVARASGVEQLGFGLEIETRLSAGGKSLALNTVKTLSTSAAGGRWRLECTCKFTTDAPAPGLTTGLEVVFNLLAPNVPDRYFLARTEAGEARHPLEFAGEVNARRLLLVDEWQRVQIVLDAGPGSRWWIAPIETISQSESGFERVYQGSAILAVWPVERMLVEFTRALSVEIELLPRTVSP